MIRRKIKRIKSKVTWDWKLDLDKISGGELVKVDIPSPGSYILRIRTILNPEKSKYVYKALMAMLKSFEDKGSTVRWEELDDFVNDKDMNMNEIIKRMKVVFRQVEDQRNVKLYTRFINMGDLRVTKLDDSTCRIFIKVNGNYRNN